MVLCSTKNNCFFILVYFIKNNAHTLCLSFFYFNNLIKIRLSVNLPFFYFSLDNLIVRNIHILIKCCFDSLYLKGREKTIVYTFLERVRINRLAKITIRIDVVFSFWCCSKSELYCRRKVLQNTSPITFIVCTTPMTLINDDKIKEIRWVFSKVWCSI